MEDKRYSNRPISNLEVIEKIMLRIKEGSFEIIGSMSYGLKGQDIDIAMLMDKEDIKDKESEIANYWFDYLYKFRDELKEKDVDVFIFTNKDQYDAVIQTREKMRALMNSSASLKDILTNCKEARIVLWIYFLKKTGMFDGVDLSIKQALQ